MSTENYEGNRKFAALLGTVIKSINTTTHNDGFHGEVTLNWKIKGGVDMLEIKKEIVENHRP